jgi:hypothetical protein
MQNRSEVLSAAISPSQPAWNVVLWPLLFTLLWTWLTYRAPALLESGIAAMAVRLLVHGLIALGLWLGLANAELTAEQRRTTWVAIMVPFTLWMAIAWGSGINGLFRPDASSLPLLPMAIFVPLIVGTPLLLLSGRVGQVLDAMPLTWLVALQLYRVFGSQWLVYWLHGSIPGLFGLPAATGDVLTGLFALPVAIGLAAGSAEGRKAAVLWNIFGIADFVVAVSMGVITSPGPLQLIVPNGSSIGSGTYPNVLTPAFVVPCSILLHLLSLRQLYRRNRVEAARR